MFALMKASVRSTIAKAKLAEPLLVVRHTGRKVPNRKVAKSRIVHVVLVVLDKKFALAYNSVIIVGFTLIKNNTNELRLLVSSAEMRRNHRCHYS